MVAVGDYVLFKENKEEKYGRVTKVEGGNMTITGADEKPHTIAEADVSGSTMARLSMNAGPNSLEIVENSVAMAIYNKFIAGRTFMGPENVSFLVAEILHEYLLKGYVATWADMLVAPSIKTDASGFMQSDDFTDPLRKLPFVFALQQIFQNLFYKKPLSFGAMHNLLGGYSALAVSNVADRMFTNEKGKEYRYP